MLFFACIKIRQIKFTLKIQENASGTNVDSDSDTDSEPVPNTTRDCGCDTMLARDNGFDLLQGGFCGPSDQVVDNDIFQAGFCGPSNQGVDISQAGLCGPSDQIVDLLMPQGEPIISITRRNPAPISNFNPILPSPSSAAQSGGPGPLLLSSLVESPGRSNQHHVVVHPLDPFPVQLNTFSDSFTPSPVPTAPAHVDPPVLLCGGNNILQQSGIPGQVKKTFLGMNFGHFCVRF